MDWIKSIKKTERLKYLQQGNIYSIQACNVCISSTRTTTGNVRYVSAPFHRTVYIIQYTENNNIVLGAEHCVLQLASCYHNMYTLQELVGVT